MSKVPKDATRYHNHTYYKAGSGHYALYFSKGTWRESASIPNSQLPEIGVSCVRKLSKG